ncbi:hypothetical protein NMY22_g6636 [Coprinellus aureogranulatus]|nr:hypothetical protein NMY22_g6636 [Coprinellus aureogranulatus]
MVRGTGKFKQKRGGGRNFSKHLDVNEDASNFGNHRSRNRDDDDSEEDSEEESEEEEEDDEEESGDEAGGADQPELTRAERKALKKKQAEEKLKKKQEEEGDDEDADLINPNHVTKQLKISDLGNRELSRREREEKEKKEAKERYWKLHTQGKTQEAKTDLARLAKIRAEREAPRPRGKQRLKSPPAKAAEIEAKKQQQMAKRKI